MERAWRSLKYECIYPNALETGSEARNGIGRWTAYYNEIRLHSSHGRLIPAEVYDSQAMNLKVAACHETHPIALIGGRPVEYPGSPLNTNSTCWKSHESTYLIMSFHDGRVIKIETLDHPHRHRSVPETVFFSP
uniref:integrase core domain-containing protein n=1 Tax=Tritonibacter scottomollicae TaxID=483013 RepID=UPI00374CD99D